MRCGGGVEDGAPRGGGATLRVTGGGVGWADGQGDIGRKQRSEYRERGHDERIESLGERRVVGGIRLSECLNCIGTGGEKLAQRRGSTLAAWLPLSKMATP